MVMVTRKVISLRRIKIMRNMKYFKNIFTGIALLFACIGSMTFTACSDDMPSDSYYTFTGEMMSDYLQNHEDFNQFAAIVKRASSSTRGVNLMDLLSVRGQYTCFAPTNEAVAKYLAANGYASVNDIPADICDTLARTHLVNGKAYNTVDFANYTSLPMVNMNDRYLTIKPDTVVDAETKDTLYVNYLFNRTSEIIYSLRNDSVENGIVQPISAVLSVSNQTVPDLMLENPNVSLFVEAMEATGLAFIMRNKVQDATWNPDLYESKSVYTGAQWDYCHIPEQKKFGFTVFACPNDVLSAKYNITDLKSFYDYAHSVYGTPGDGKAWDDVKDDLDKLKDWRNPLRRLIGYNCLDRSSSYNNLTTICTIDTKEINPTEWYSTMDSLTTIKCEKLTVPKYINGGVRNDIYLNRGDHRRGDMASGIHVSKEVTGGYEQQALNGWYYTTDGLADYINAQQDNVFNTRMRIDLYTIFPEMMNNNIRDGRTANFIAESNNPDKSVTSPNYWFPSGYLDNVKINEDGTFLFQSQHNTYWSYEGDEFNLCSETESYDMTFNLPSVPSGQYQIRLGFADMPTRGICQFYLDGNPEGSPFDQRDANFESRSGWYALTSGNNRTDEENEAAKKNMHNLGWYHGPRGVFSISGEGHEDGDESVTRNFFCNNARTVRFVLWTGQLNEGVQHTIRIKSVWAPENAVVMIDYLEIVPKSVYGVEGAGRAEDDY